MKYCWIKNNLQYFYIKHFFKQGTKKNWNAVGSSNLNKTFFLNQNVCKIDQNYFVWFWTFWNAVGSSGLNQILFDQNVHKICQILFFIFYFEHFVLYHKRKTYFEVFFLPYHIPGKISYSLGPTYSALATHISAYKNKTRSSEIAIDCHIIERCHSSTYYAHLPSHGTRKSCYCFYLSHIIKVTNGIKKYEKQQNAKEALL